MSRHTKVCGASYARVTPTGQTYCEKTSDTILNAAFSRSGPCASAQMSGNIQKAIGTIEWMHLSKPLAGSLLAQHDKKLVPRM